MMTTYDQEIRPACEYGAKCIDDMGKYRVQVRGSVLMEWYRDPDLEIEAWHLETCPCGRGRALPDWALY